MLCRFTEAGTLRGALGLVRSVEQRDVRGIISKNRQDWTTGLRAFWLYRRTADVLRSSSYWLDCLWLDSPGGLSRFPIAAIGTRAELVDHQAAQQFGVRVDGL